jgi:flagellar biosynthesis protein FliR
MHYSEYYEYGDYLSAVINNEPIDKRNHILHGEAQQNMFIGIALGALARIILWRLRIMGI